MTDHKEIINTFYTCFSQLDAEGMVACYHPDVVFEDPAFGVLNGEDAKDMWRMLIHRGKSSLEVKLVNLDSTTSGGHADWVASYFYGQRRVINFIHADFKFKDGLIIEHRDHFNLWRWARQAIGFNGLLLGWTPWFKKQVQKQSAAHLHKYQEKYKSS